MVSTSFHKSIRWFITLVLILSLFGESLGFTGGNTFEYGVVLALVYLMFRTPLKYHK